MPGLVLVLIGVLFLLFNLNILPYDLKRVFFSWQMLLIGIGLLIFASRNYTSGSIVILVGAFFLVPLIKRVYPDSLFWMPDISWSTSWPVILIIIGIILVLRSFFPKRNRFNEDWHKAHVENEEARDRYKSENIRSERNTKKGTRNINDTFDLSTIFNGTRHIIMSHNFERGEVDVIFGEARIDMENAILSPLGALIEANAIFGSVVIIVPRDWNVSFDTTAIFGSGEDKRSFVATYDPAKPTLTIKGECMFGSIELIN